MTLALHVTLLIFGLPICGSIFLLYCLTSLFILVSLALGIVISTVTKTQMQAMQLSFFVFLPSILLSGFMFTSEAMPHLFFLIGKVLPLTYYLEIIRGIMLNGIGLNFLWSQVISLAAFICAALIVSIVNFQIKLT